MPGSDQALTYNYIACSLCTLPQRLSFPMSLGSDSALSTARLTVSLRAVLLLLEVCLSLIVFFQIQLAPVKGITLQSIQQSRCIVGGSH